MMDRIRRIGKFNIESYDINDLKVPLVIHTLMIAFAILSRSISTSLVMLLIVAIDMIVTACSVHRTVYKAADGIDRMAYMDRYMLKLVFNIPFILVVVLRLTYRILI